MLLYIKNFLRHCSKRARVQVCLKHNKTSRREQRTIKSTVNGRAFRKISSQPFLIDKKADCGSIREESFITGKWSWIVTNATQTVALPTIIRGAFELLAQIFFHSSKVFIRRKLSAKIALSTPSRGLELFRRRCE